MTKYTCHCEERSDVAIHNGKVRYTKQMDCFTMFAMTNE